MGPTSRAAAAALLALLLAAGPAGCVSGEDIFTRGRLEDLCSGNVPACESPASCVLGDDRFIRRSFPGGERVVVRVQEPDTELVVRVLFDEMVYPGTQLIVEALGPRCASVADATFVDVDVFALAGEDRVLQVPLKLVDTGDHVLELFSDMNATWILTVDTND